MIICYLKLSRSKWCVSGDSGDGKKNIDTVRYILTINEHLRDNIYSQSINDNILLNQLKAPANANDWRIFDHCASVTRLYAIYEQFVESLIKDWLEILPKLYTEYAELPDKIIDTHQLGVGKILIDFKKDRYKNLNLETVIGGIFKGITKQREYKLLPDAFLIHEQNLRKDILEKMFTQSGIDNTWDWINKSRHIIKFCEDDQVRPDEKLRELIEYRNDAAHRGNIDDILSYNELIKLCNFLEVFCQALTERVTYQVIKRKVNIQQATKVGIITEYLSKKEAAIIKIEADNIRLFVGQEVFLQGEVYCQVTKIQSIQIHDAPSEETVIYREMELGVKFSVPAKKGLEVYLINLS